MRARPWARFTTLLAATPIAAMACGVCVEDKVAATYDHALVRRALERHRVVVFAEPRTAVDPCGCRRSQRPLRTPGGAGPQRRSAAPQSVSFVLDPTRASPRPRWPPCSRPPEGDRPRRSEVKRPDLGPVFARSTCWRPLRRAFRRCGRRRSGGFGAYRGPCGTRTRCCSATRL